MTSPEGTRQRRRDPVGGSSAVHWRSKSNDGAGRGPRLWLTVVLTLLILHPYLLLGAIHLPGQDAATFAGHVATVVADLVLLGAALVLTFDTRLTADPTRWACAVIAAFTALQDLPLVVLALGDPAMSGYGYRFSYGHLVTVGLMVAVLAAARRREAAPSVNPLLVGAGLGGLVLVVRVGVFVSVPSPFLEVGSSVDLLVALVIAGCLLASAVLLWRSTLPAWAAWRLAIAMASIFSGRLLSMVIDAETPPPVAVGAVALCSALVATTAAGLLRQSLNATTRHLHSLLELAAGAEESARQGREVAHEVRATTAGIVAGARLLSSRTLPEGPQRAAIAAMLDSEASRLGRVLDDGLDPTGEVDLDETVRLLVVAHAALDHRVTWEPGGHVALGRPDVVSEAINALLHNVRRHADGVGTRITFARIGDDVEVRVADHGPGVDPAVVDQLFEWGARRTDSPGEGIGLQRARRLLRAQGASLHLDRSTAAGRGATFVVTLPWARSTGAESATGLPVGVAASREGSIGFEEQVSHDDLAVRATGIAG